MAKRDFKKAQIYTPFEENARKLFPFKSMYQITKELNIYLEEKLYGIQKPKKRKHY